MRQLSWELAVCAHAQYKIVQNSPELYSPLTHSIRITNKSTSGKPLAHLKYFSGLNERQNYIG